MHNYMTDRSLPPLFTLLKQIEQERDRVLGTEQQARRALDSSRAQEAQLEQYRREYEARWQLQARQKQAVEVMHCYQNFMRQLQRAVDFQQQRTARAQASTEQARAARLALEIRVASVRKLIERRQHEAAQAAHRTEQKASDEQAARSARFAPTGITQFGPATDFMRV